MALVTYQDARPWARAIKTQGGQSRNAAVVRRSEIQPRAGEQPQPDPGGNRHHRRVGGFWRRARHRLTADAAAVHRRVAQLQEPSARRHPRDAVAFDVPAEGALPVFTSGRRIPFRRSVHRGGRAASRRGRRGASFRRDRASPARRHDARTRSRVEGRAARGLRADLSRRTFVQRAQRRRRIDDLPPSATPERAARRCRTRRFGRATTTACCSTCRAADFRSFHPVRSSASAPAMCSRGTCTTRRRASRSTTVTAWACGSRARRRRTKS